MKKMSNFNELEDIENNQMDNTVTTLKVSMGGFNNRTRRTHERMRELEGTTVEITQPRHQREHRLKNKMNRIIGDIYSYNKSSITKDLGHQSPRRRKESR